MLLTKNSPIKVKVNVIPRSTLAFGFLVKGSRSVAKVNVSIVIYYKHPHRCNTISSVGSDTLVAYTYENDRYYNVDIEIPEFKNRIESFILFRSEKFGNDISIENIKIMGHSYHKTGKSKIEEAPIPKPPTIDEFVDSLVDRYKKELPKDSMNRIFYIRPWTNDSFGIVSNHHIQYIRLNIKEREEKNGFIIEDINWSSLGKINWDEKKNILLHPFLYPFASPQTFEQNIHNFAKLLAKKNKIGGFDVADSNKISQTAVDLVNKIDLIMVPSNFSKDTYINSGVEIPVEVLPHGTPDEFLDDDPINTNNMDIARLKKEKDKDSILILYFLLHSGHRKGADIVKDVMKKIQKEYPKAYLVVKGNDVKANFPGIKTIEIKSWIDNKDLRLLYDICDICISPSRGGGFELNALEAISRGVPTMVTNGGCFLDMIDHFIPINTKNKIARPLPGNPIHIGYGFEVDIDDFEKKLVDVIDNLDRYKDDFRRNMVKLRYKYSWRNTASILEEYLRKYEFIY